MILKQLLPRLLVNEQFTNVLDKTNDNENKLSSFILKHRTYDLE